AFREAVAPAAERTQVLSNSRLADVDAVEADLDRAVVREQVRGLVPEAFVDVVAVRVLELFDLGRVADALRAQLEPREPPLERGMRRRRAGFVRDRVRRPARVAASGENRRGGEHA